MLTADGVEIPDELFEYMQLPTLMNAQNALKAIGCPIPFHGFDATTAHDQVPSSTRHRRGGDGEWVANMAIVDLLHDLREDFPMPANMVDWILNTGGAVFTDTVKTQISNIMTSDKRNVTPALSRLLHTMPKAHTIKVKGEIQRFSLEQNTALYNSMTLVVMRHANQPLNIVLDGLYKAFSSPMDEVDAARSLALCAFVHTMLGNCPSIPISRTTRSHGRKMSLDMKYRNRVKASNIVFLTGEFQTIDIPGYNTFLEKLVSDLAKEIQIADAVSVRRIDSPPPLDKDFVVLDTFIKFKQSRIPILGDPNFRLQQKVGIQIVETIHKRLYATIGKSTLRGIFRTLFALNPAELHHQLTVDLVNKVARINLFRDAYRADVAIQSGSYYITLDRLAQVYYVKRSKETNTPVQSLLFSYNPTIPETISFGFA